MFVHTCNEVFTADGSANLEVSKWSKKQTHSVVLLSVYPATDLHLRRWAEFDMTTHLQLTLHAIVKCRTLHVTVRYNCLVFPRPLSLHSLLLFWLSTGQIFDSSRRIVVPEAKDMFRWQDESFAARSAQRILKCRLTLHSLDETMEAGWKAWKDFEYHCVEPQEPTVLCCRLFD